jgi:hypothetical protein
MPTTSEQSREHRCVVVGADDRYAILGRDFVPSERKMRGAEKFPRAQALAGSLPILEGNPYVGAGPRLIDLHLLAGPAVPFAEPPVARTRAIARGADFTS